MIELPLLLMAGLLGSSHCLGMCGPFALILGSGPSNLRTNIARQGLYTAGRVFTYAFLGAAAGFGGWRLAGAIPAVNIPATLALVAGVLLIYQGLAAAGVMRKRGVGAASGSCTAGSLFASFLRSRSWTNVFLAGLLTGLLPCGLLYGMLALAGSTHDPARGALAMIVFGLGTAPAMILAGVSGSLLSLATRRHVFRIAAWCLVLAGAISLARGASYLSLSGEPPAGCPLCQEASDN